MTSLSRFAFAFLLLTIAACTPAKSPLSERQSATFALIPEKTDAEAELGQATPDSFGRPRTQLLHFTICLQSNVTGEPVAMGTRFAIVDVTGTAITREATGGGCLHWDEEHGVSPLAPERNVRVERRVRALSNHRGELLLTFNVKPWLAGKAAVQSASNLEQFTGAIAADTGLGFGDQYPLPADTVPGAKGLSVVPTTTSAPADPAADRPRFLLADNHIELSYLSGGRSPEFEIDSFLNLTMPYRFSFAIRPLITRKVFSGSRVSEPMTSGRVRLTLVFFASARGEFREDNRYLTSAQVEGEVEPNGVFSGTITVKYPHAHFASGRQTVLAQLSAPGQSTVEASSFAGSLSFIDQQGAMLMLKDGRDAEQIHLASTRAREAQTAARTTPLADFLRTHDVVRMDTTAAAIPDLSSEELTRALDVDGLNAPALREARRDSVAVRLCRAFLKSDLPKEFFNSPLGFLNFNPDLTAAQPSFEERYLDNYCGDTKRLPTKYVDVRQLDFVEELVSKTPRNVKIVTYSNQDFGLYYSRDDAKVRAQNVAFGLHAQAPEILGVFGDMSFVWSKIATRSQRSSFAQSQTMAIDMGSLEVHARVRSCVLITALEKPFTAKPWLICQPAAKAPAWIPEEYFYYSQLFGANHSPFIDPFDAQTGVKLLVRGRHQMQRISAKLQYPDYAKTGFNVIIQTRQPVLSEIDTTGVVDELTNQAVPGAWLRN